MPTPLVTTRPRMKRVRHRTEPERGGGVELARGRGSDRRVLVKWDDGVQRFHDRAEILPEGKTMKISKQQLKRIIKEEKQKLSELGISRGEETMARDLYVNLEDAQLEALDALELALQQCLDSGVPSEDVKDTVRNWV